MRRLIAGTAAAATAAILAVLPATAAVAHEDGADSPSAHRGEQVADSGEAKRMRAIANRQYDSSGEAQAGSDIEFVRIGRRDFALAGTLRKGMQIVNIDNPRDPRRVATYDCDVSQGDIQVWAKGQRILASYTADGTFGAAGAASRCAKSLGLGSDASGTVIVNVTRPRHPRTVGFAPVPRGSHNMTVHPSGNHLYNSNSDLATSTEPTIRIFDISRPAEPRKIRDFPIPFVPASLGSESHDITFNASGTRAYSAALSQTIVLDTSNPRRPEIISDFTDPATAAAAVIVAVALGRNRLTSSVQLLPGLAGDPFGLGWDLLGPSVDGLDPAPFGVDGLLAVQVAVLVIGHLVGAFVVAWRLGRRARMPATVVLPC